MNEEKSAFSTKIRTFFWKFNPYRKLNIIEEDGQILDPQWFLYYSAFIQWLVDILLDGVVSNFIISLWGFQQFNVIYSLGNGLAIWFMWRILTKGYDYYVNGQVTIARNQD